MENREEMSAVCTYEEHIKAKQLSDHLWNFLDAWRVNKGTILWTAQLAICNFLAKLCNYCVSQEKKNGRNFVTLVNKGTIFWTAQLAICNFLVKLPNYCVNQGKKKIWNFVTLVNHWPHIKFFFFFFVFSEYPCYLFESYFLFPIHNILFVYFHLLGFNCNLWLYTYFLNNFS